MKVTAFGLLFAALGLQAQPQPNPILVDQFRDQLNQVKPDPVRDVTDSATRSREALRLPLNADPNLSLAELQAAQNRLLRMNDMMNAEADRAALANQTHQFVPQLLTVPLRTVPRTAGKDTPQSYVPPPPTAARPAPPDVHSRNLALTKPTRQSSTRFFPSRGGVDGRITGTPGFYTELQNEPWWDVDLQQTSSLHEIRIYNSKIDPERAKSLRVLLSADGVKWTPAYTHDGSNFGVDGQPLRIPLSGVQARWVRIQLGEKNYLHLDEVEIY